MPGSILAHRSSRSTLGRVQIRAAGSGSTSFSHDRLLLFDGPMLPEKPARQGRRGRTPPLKEQCLRGRLGRRSAGGPRAIPLPLAARVQPLSFLLADQTEPPRHIARNLGEPANPAALRGQRKRAARGLPCLAVREPMGASTLHVQAVNEAQHARAWVASLERECERCAVSSPRTSIPRRNRRPTRRPITPSRPSFSIWPV
jgi:hypothetical protein